MSSYHQTSFSHSSHSFYLPLRPENNSGLPRWGHVWLGVPKGASLPAALPPPHLLLIWRWLERRRSTLRIGPGVPIPIRICPLLSKDASGLEVPLSIRVNFSSHSSFWNEPNLSHLFLELFPEVEILISFYPLDIRVRKWTCQSGIFNLVILKQCSTFKFDGRVAVNFSLSSDRLYIVIYLYVCQATIPFIWLYNWLLVTHCFPTACSAPLTTASTFLPFPSWLSQPPGQRWPGRPRRSHQMILPSKMIKGLCYAFALDDFIIKSKNACHTMCQVSF